jgi:hypothetical protein
MTSLDASNLLFSQASKQKIKMKSKKVNKTLDLEIIKESSGQKKNQLSDSKLKKIPKFLQKSKKEIKRKSESFTQIKSRSGRLRRMTKNEDNPIVKLMKKPKTDKKKNHSKIGCSCTNTKCIQMYCRCFRNDTLCGSKCKCLNCVNRKQHTQIRTTLKNVLVEKDNLSFSKRFQKIEVTVIKENGEMVKEGKRT